jgi:hypothetical protein
MPERIHAKREPRSQQRSDCPWVTTDCL